MAERYYLGIDLGGTNIKAGIVTETAKVLSKLSVTTDAECGPDHVLSRMCEAGEEAIKQSGISIQDVTAIGVGAPGALSHKKGIIIAPPNLPGWKNVPVRDYVSRYFNKPATLDNDANAAAWGEYWAGAGRGKSSLVMFTLGTGVGGGIVYDGKFLRGHYDTAAELGHIIVEPNGKRCNCGQIGCLEIYASAINSAKIATEELKAGRKSSMQEELSAGKLITTEIILNHKLKGDSYAEEIWNRTCRYIAIGCVSMDHVINAEIIVLAGGMVAAGEYLLKPVQKFYQELQGPVFGNNSGKIVLAELGNDAGFVGAAGAAKLCEEVGSFSGL
jgi:glucokinase